MINFPSRTATERKRERERQTDRQTDRDRQTNSNSLRLLRTTHILDSILDS